MKKEKNCLLSLTRLKSQTSSESRQNGHHTAQQCLTRPQQDDPSQNGSELLTRLNSTKGNQEGKLLTRLNSDTSQQ